MSAYAMEATNEVMMKEVPVTPAMKKIRVLLEHIEEMKRKIVEVQFNDNMPFVIKSHKLDEMRVSLKQVEAHTVTLMADALQDLYDDASDGGGV